MSGASYWTVLRISEHWCPPQALAWLHFTPWHCLPPSSLTPYSRSDRTGKRWAAWLKRLLSTWSNLCSTWCTQRRQCLCFWALPFWWPPRKTSMPVWGCRTSFSSCVSSTPSAWSSPSSFLWPRNMVPKAPLVSSAFRLFCHAAASDACSCFCLFVPIFAFTLFWLDIVQLTRVFVACVLTRVRCEHDRCGICFFFALHFDSWCYRQWNLNQFCLQMKLSNIGWQEFWAASFKANFI